MSLPIGLFGVSIATAVLPVVSRQTAERNDEAVRDTVANGVSLMLMLNVPASVGLIVLAHPIASDPRAGPVLRGHGRDGSGPAVLRARSARVFGRSHRVTDLLRARPQSHAGHDQCHDSAGECRAECDAGARARVPRTGARHLDRCAVQRRPLLTLLRRELHGIHDGRIVSAFVRIGAAAARWGSSPRC